MCVCMCVYIHSNVAIKILKHSLREIFPPFEKREHVSKSKREDKEHRCRIFHFIKPLASPTLPSPLPLARPSTAP